MIDAEQEKRIEEWCRLGREIYDAREKLGKWKGIFVETYTVAGRDMVFADLKEGYKEFWRAATNARQKDLDLANRISQYVSVGRLLFPDEGSRQEVYDYLKRKGMMPLADEAEAKRRQWEANEARRREQQEAERQRREEEARRRQQEADARQRQQEEEKRRREAEAAGQEAERQRREEEAARRAYEAEKAERAQRRQQYAQKPKKRSKWWLWVAAVVAVGFGVSRFVSASSDGDVVPDYSHGRAEQAARETGARQNASRATEKAPASKATESAPADRTLEAEQAAPKVDISPILRELRQQMDSQNGKSQAETCAEYGALDGLRHIDQLLRKAEKAAPGNGEVKKYRRKFNQILSTYNITL